MKFILLDKREPRCRPEKPNTVLHNDCGNQKACARRLAANTVGAPEQDFSKSASMMMGVFVCGHYLSAEGRSESVGRH